MKVLIVMSLAVAALASHDGIILKGPSGIITPHGPIGPDGRGPTGGDWDGHDGAWGGNVGAWAGHGGWAGGNGAWGHGDDGQWHGEGLHESQWQGEGLHAGAGAAVYGAGWGGWGNGGWDGHHGGVAVVGPHTVPATVVGPAGKVHAAGLWGPTNAWGHGGHHGHW